MIKAAHLVTEHETQSVKRANGKMHFHDAQAVVPGACIPDKLCFDEVYAISLSAAPSVAAPSVTASSEPPSGAGSLDGSVNEKKEDLPSMPHVHHLRPEVQRLIKALPESGFNTDAEEEARALLRHVLHELQHDWHLLEELVPDDLVERLLQCCYVEKHPLKRMSFILLTHIADLMSCSAEAYRLMSNLMPDRHGAMPEFLYKCSSYFTKPCAPYEERFAYSFFVGLMYNESPTTFVERNRMTPLLSHVERRYAQLEQATRTGVYASPTLVTALLRKLLTLVGSDAIHSARDSDDHMASFQRMYALTQDKSARLLITQLLGLDAAALQKQAADRAAADAWEAKMHERMAAQEAGLVPLLQYEAKELRDNLARVGRPWKRLAGMAWKRGVRVWHAAVAE